MQITTPTISKKAITVLATLGVIGMVYVFYFFVYVAGNKLETQEKAFRILDKIGHNIQEKQKNTKKNVSIIFETIEKELYPKDSLKSIKNIDTIRKEYHRDNINNDLKFNSIGNKFRTIDDTNTSEKYSHLYYKKSKEEFCIEFKMSLKDFIKPLLRKDVFDELIIIRSDGSNPKISYQTFKNKIQLHTQDSLFYLQNGIRSSKTRTITVEEIPYKVFTYNLAFEADKQWLIAGCIKEKKYQTETRSISFWTIINTSLLAVLLLFSMPVLKLVLMNFIERLHRSTVILSGLSVIMGASIVVLFILIESNYRSDLEKTDGRLDLLSNEVKSKLNNELNAVYEQLSDYDKSLCDKFDSIKIIKGYPIISDVTNESESIINKKILKPFEYKRFNEVFWMDSLGMQKLQYSISKKKSNQLTDLRNRDYFKHVIIDKLWHPLNFRDPVYIQSIVSWSSGEREIAVSKKGIWRNEYPVAAITAKFQSVIDAILPIGYGFSIISPNGEVLIHSDSNKNLQENFIEESKDDPLLKSAIYSKIELKTTINYLGKKHRVNITPLEGMPIFLIVYNNLDHMKTSVSEIWSITFLFVLGSFVMLAVLLLLLWSSQLKTSKLRTKQFFFKWMLPRPNKLKKYKKLLVSNVLVILIIILFCYTNSQNHSVILFSLFIIPSLVFLLIYDRLNSFDNNIKKKIGFRIFSALFLLAINLFYFRGTWETLKIYPILFQIAIIIAFIPFKGLYKWGTDFIFKKLKFNDLNRVFSVFLLTWLLSSAIIPIIYFYKTAYTIESKIWSKYALLDMSRSIESQMDDEKNAFTSKDLEDEIYKPKENNYHGVYHEFLGIEFKKKKSTDSINNTKDSPLDSLLFYLRPGYYKNTITENRGLVYTSAIDNSFDWMYPSDSISLTHNLTDNKSTRLNLAKKIDKIHFLGSPVSAISVLISVIIILVFLLVFYWLISFCVNKIYALEFLNYIKTFDGNPTITKKIITNNNTILIGLPGSGKTALLKEHYEEGNLEDCLLINCITIGHKKDWNAYTKALKVDQYNTIILDNFEYNNDDHLINDKKLKFLEELLQRKKHIVILSEIEPIEVIDIYYRAILEMNEEESKKRYEDVLEIWRHTFSHFIEVYKPLEINKLDIKNKLIQKELQFGSFLKKLSSIFEYKIDQINKMKDDEIILDIQQHAKSYYYALWNALTNKEKFAVYDIAKDGFINTKNRPIINTLLKKGLLCFNDNKLQLINKSFANFVLSVLTKEDLLKMDLEVKKKGKWVNIKLIFLLVIISLIILIGFGKPGFFKNINTIMIAIAGVASIIPSLTRGFTFAQKIK